VIPLVLPTIKSVTIFALETILPVAFITPPVIKLPPVILPDAIKVLAEITLTLDTLPPDPDVTILPTVALPVTFSVPATLTPVPVTIKIFALPATLVVTLPFADTNTLLFPFTIVLCY